VGEAGLREQRAKDAGTFLHLTFIGPYIMIYFYSKTNDMHQFLKFISFCSSTLLVSDGLSVHHQESKTVHTASGISQTDSADCLLAGMRWNCSSISFPLADAVCTVLDSWWWTERPKHVECSNKIKIKYEKLMHLLGFTIQTFLNVPKIDGQAPRRTFTFDTLTASYCRKTSNPMPPHSLMLRWIWNWVKLKLFGWCLSRTR